MQKKWTAKDFSPALLKQFQVTLNTISLLLCVCYNFFTLTNVVWCRKQTKTVIVCACLHLISKHKCPLLEAGESSREFVNLPARLSMGYNVTGRKAEPTQGQMPGEVLPGSPQD